MTNTATLTNAAATLREVAASGVASDNLAQSYRDAAQCLENMAQAIEVPAADIKPGTLLRNGYLVVAVKPKDHGGDGMLNSVIVLAVRPDDGEYCTWFATSSDNTFWGHYESDFATAAADFQAR